MSNNWESTPESDVFRLENGTVRPLLKDDDGNLFEPISPGSSEDPFTFRPVNLNDILYGLNKVSDALERGDPKLALVMAERCQTALERIVESEQSEKERLWKELVTQCMDFDAGT